jgi:anti-anti-sigma factor
MAISSEFNKETNTLIINITGSFDINVYQKFGESYKDYLKPEYSIIIDLSETEYMDSSALGMLLMLRERAGGESSSITIRNCTDGIKKILSTANFQRLFNINE